MTVSDQRLCVCVCVCVCVYVIVVGGSNVACVVIKSSTSCPQHCSATPHLAALRVTARPPIHVDSRVQRAGLRGGHVGCRNVCKRWKPKQFRLAPLCKDVVVVVYRNNAECLQLLEQQKDARKNDAICMEQDHLILQLVARNTQKAKNEDASENNGHACMQSSTV
jgi:hypothetical protein